tara:strand:+ start:103 stop:687 length:585 start_codon:yes stop_codon:yes gene_type:complete
MSIIAMKRKAMNQKNLSHNREFSLFRSDNSSKSVGNTSQVLRNRKKWRQSTIPSDDIPSELQSLVTDPMHFRKIYNNWVQTISASGNGISNNGDQSSYLESKVLKATNYNCDFTGNTNTDDIKHECRTGTHKDMYEDASTYMKYKHKKKMCSVYTGGINKPFPFPVSGAKLSYTTCQPPVIKQVNGALDYYTKQ